MTPKTAIKAPKTEKTAKSPTCRVFIDPRQLKPSPENEKIYRPVNPKDPEVIALGKSISKNGVLEELKITKDWYIVSGHRRQVGAILAGLDVVPCTVLDYYRGGGDEADDPDSYIRLLASHNCQRVKSRAEAAREAFVKVDKEDAYRRLIEYRDESARIIVETQPVRYRGPRPKINMNIKGAMVTAIIGVIFALRNLWPISVRQVHYRLLNNPPMRNKRDRYENNSQCYDDTSDLLVRLRLTGKVPWEAIGDDTRPQTIWSVHTGPSTFIEKELSGFLRGYRRNLQQSQPNHIEVVAEKLTVEGIIRPVCGKYNIPYSIGRGYDSITPVKAMADRFFASGKEKLVLLGLSDHDPDGHGLADSLMSVLREDFGVPLEFVRVAIKPEHITRFKLPAKPQDAKKTSSRYEDFAMKHGDSTWELEALDPENIRKLLVEAIDSVLDLEAFNHELEAEKKDWVSIDTVRRETANATREILEGVEFPYDEEGDGDGD